MIRFGILFFILFISLTISLPTCNVSYWVNSQNLTCSSSPNGTYSALNYSGDCTLSPDDSKTSSYKLLINTDTKIVLNFTVFDDKTCGKDNTVLMAKTPLSLDSCGLLYFIDTLTSSFTIGNLIFSCKD